MGMMEKKLSRLRKTAVYRFIRSSPEEYKYIKMIMGFPFGVLLGTGLYFSVVDRMMFSEFIRYMLGFCIGLALAVGCAISVQVRCISVLVIPHFFGKEGRSFIGTFAIAYLLTGPIANIMFNAEEISRAISCGSELSMNQTLARMDLKYKPIREVMADIQRQGKNIHKSAAKVKKKFRPMKKEVKDESEISKYQKNEDYVDTLDPQQHESRGKGIEERYNKDDKSNVEQRDEAAYKRKLDYRCEDVFNMGVIRCRKIFKDMDNKCLAAVGKIPGGKILDFLCFPFKLSALCELVRWVLPSVSGVDCSSTDALNPGFGEAFETADKTSNEFDKNFEVNMQYKLVTGKQEVDQMTPVDVSKGIAYEFQRRNVWVDFVTMVIQRVMAFLFIRIFIGAYNYHKRYTTNIRYDNIYITGYFRKIDARRHKQGKRTLLPLKKIEAKERIEPLKCKLMGPEKSKMVKSTVKVFLRLATCGVIIFVDRLIYEALAIISKHSRVDYHQTGEHHIRLIIYGNGVMGHVVRSILQGFNRKHTLDKVSTNFACLPRPKKLPVEYIWKIVGIYIVMWVMMYFEAYGLRLRRLSASFFYRKREKTRVLYLYNDMLKKRAGFLHHMRHRVRKLAREKKLSMRTDILMALRYQWPRLCRCITVFGAGKKKCLVCEEPEAQDSHHCKSPGCNFIYCHGCWKDLKKKCYACAKPSDSESDSDSDLTDIDI